LRERYKMDPEIMREVDETYGPLEWRLPESHSIYWATVGFDKSRKKDLITLRRTIYQPLQMAFQRGRLIEIHTEEGTRFQFGPNLAMLPRANQAYLDMAEGDPEYRDHIRVAHRNFLKDAVYFLYTHNRRGEAEKWWAYLLEQYPDAMFTDVRTPTHDSVRLADITLDDYAAAKVTEDVGETSNVRMRSNIEGLLLTSYFYLANDLDDEAIGHERLARVAHERFMREIGRSKQQGRVGLPEFDAMKREALEVFRQNYEPEFVARLYTRLGLPLPSATEADPPAE
jgi:hypothetical protein